MVRIAVTLAVVCVVMAAAVAPAGAQLPLPVQLGLPAATQLLGGGLTPVVSYAWYQPARDEVESGKGLEVAAVFKFLGPIKTRLQYSWPQSGGYSNLGLAAVVNWGGSIYAGAGYERTSGRETSPVVRDIDETQPYAFVGLTQKSQLYSIIFEAERSFGSELNGTTLKAGMTMGW